MAVPVHEREGDGEAAVIVQTQVAVCCIYVGLTTFGIVFIVISFIQLYEKKNQDMAGQNQGVLWRSDLFPE